VLATWHSGRVSVVLSCGHFRFSIPTHTHIVPLLPSLPSLHHDAQSPFRCMHARPPHSTQVVLKKKNECRQTHRPAGWFLCRAGQRIQLAFITRGRSTGSTFCGPSAGTGHPALSSLTYSHFLFLSLPYVYLHY